jgi:hypothetical protein
MSQILERNAIRLSATRPADITLSQFGLPQPQIQNSTGGIGIPQLGPTAPAGTQTPVGDMNTDTEIYLNRRELRNLMGYGAEDGMFPRMFQ